MPGTANCVAVKEIARGVPRAKTSELEPIAALFRSDDSAWNVDLLSNEGRAGSAEAIGANVKSTSRKSLVAVLRWEEGELSLLAPEIIGERAVLAEVDLSSVDRSRRGAAMTLAFQGLCKGTIDVVISSHVQPILDMGSIDGDCIIVRFQHKGIELTLVTQQLPRLGMLLSGDAAKLLPFELGQPLKEVEFIEEIATSGNNSSEPFRRTLRKLRSLGITCNTDGPGVSRDHEDAFRLTPGWTTEAAVGEVVVVLSCNDPGEPCTWLTLKAQRRCKKMLAVANSLLSLIATPDQEWHRWLA